MFNGFTNKTIAGLAQEAGITNCGTRTTSEITITIYAMTGRTNIIKLELTHACITL